MLPSNDGQGTSPPWLGHPLDVLEQWHATRRSTPYQLDMRRGLPSSDQIGLSRQLLSLPGDTVFDCSDGQDWLNYGGLQGMPELRQLLGPLLLGIDDPGQVAIGGNSSLALMHAVVGLAWRRGLPGHRPWSEAERVRFICPVPGYDRHFAICDDFGIGMIPVALDAHGPDMDQVEAIAARDPSVRGMWCMPRHSNPYGSIYSDATVQRLAALQAAAADFTLFCDNAYAVNDHDFSDWKAPTLQAACVAAGHPERCLQFASTSKMAIPGAGVALLGASPALLHWWLAGQRACTIGPDKVNQVRHLLLFRHAAGTLEHMQRHGELLAGRLAPVMDVFARGLGGLQDVHWTRPRGGYFVTLQVPAGCATRVVELASQVGLSLTPAGVTHCDGVDPEDRFLRIAPSALSPHEAACAAQVIVCCVRLACHEQDCRRRTGRAPSLGIQAGDGVAMVQPHAGHLAARASDTRPFDP